MRVLVVHHNPTGDVTGALSMARSTASELEARGHSVRLAVTPVIDVGVSAPMAGGLPSGADSDWSADIVHLVDLVAPEGGRAARRWCSTMGCPLAVTPATDVRLWRDRTASMEIARSAAVVFALTDEERQTLLDAAVPPERIVKIPQGPVLPGRADPQRLKRRLGATGPLVVFLSRKLETKGYRHLLAAAPHIWERHPDTMVVFAGPDADGTASALFAAVADRRVVDLGVVDEDDKHSLLQAADILCVPTVADSFPLVFTEAWWCATAVVTGPFPGVGEVVRDGIDGRIVAAEPAAVAAAIIELLDDRETLERMARAGQLRAASDLNWDRAMEAVENGYRQAMRLCPMEVQCRQ